MSRAWPAHLDPARVCESGGRVGSRERRAPADAKVVEAGVGQVRAQVALVAGGLPEEDLEAQLLLLVERGGVAGVPAIVRRVAGEARGLVGGDGLGDAVHVDARVAEGLGEVARVARDGADGGLDAGVGHAHLHRVLHGPLCLVGERRGPPVPEPDRVDGKGGVEHRRGLAVALLPLHAGGDRVALAEAGRGFVAGSAGDRAVRREARVVEEPATEPDLLRGDAGQQVRELAGDAQGGGGQGTHRILGFPIRNSGDAGRRRGRAGLVGRAAGRSDGEEQDGQEGARQGQAPISACAAEPSRGAEAPTWVSSRLGPRKR